MSEHANPYEQEPLAKASYEQIISGINVLRKDQQKDTFFATTNSAAGRNVTVILPENDTPPTHQETTLLITWPRRSLRTYMQNETGITYGFDINTVTCTIYSPEAINRLNTAPVHIAAQTYYESEQRQHTSLGYNDFIELAETIGLFKQPTIQQKIGRKIIGWIDGNANANAQSYKHMPPPYF